jgi:hypothetical protein
MCNGEQKGNTMERATVLQQAEKCITQNRAETHGDPENSFSSIAHLWEWWMIHREAGPLNSYDVAMMMSLLKHARAAEGDSSYADHYIDACGYLALASEMADG